MHYNIGVEANIDEALRKIEELKAILEAMKEEEIDDKERMRRQAFIDTMNKIKERNEKKKRENGGDL